MRFERTSSSVVLPDPDGPISARTSPGFARPLTVVKICFVVVAAFSSVADLDILPLIKLLCCFGGSTNLSIPAHRTVTGGLFKIVVLLACSVAVTEELVLVEDVASNSTSTE